jgi:2-keto-4-pentenoate hydratase/2-oxohepta-3-ene-1,7-dioic acid hydratase in catechol pathway
MKLALFSLKSQLKKKKIGLIVRDRYIVDLRKAYNVYLKDKFDVSSPEIISSKIFPDNIIAFIKNGAYSLIKASEVLKYVDKDVDRFINEHVIHHLDSVKLEPPISRPSKLIGIGLNFEEYRIKLSYEKPDVPLFFLKPPSTIIGHEDIILIPRGRLPGTSSNILFHEFELGVVIGRKAKRVSKDEAYNYVLGYTIFNDITAHDIEMIQPGHVLYQQRCKAFDTFSPIGPWITLKDEIKDPNMLYIARKRNSRVEEESNTKNMLFKVHEIIEFLSEIMTLEPGDIIGMGSPPTGPNEGLQPKDMIETTIEGIGTLRNYVEEFRG